MDTKKCITDVSGLDEIFRRSHKDLCRYAKRLTFDTNSAEDLVQDAYSKVSRRIHEGETISAPLSYLYSTIMNAWLDQIRRKKNQMELPMTDTYDAIHDEYASRIEKSVEARLNLEEILRRAFNLPEKLKLDFIESCLHGKSYKDIAKKRGVAIATVKNNVCEARKRIRETFQEKGIPNRNRR